MPMEDRHELRFCPVCGGRLMSAVVKEGEPARPVCSVCGYILYLDPKLVACSIVETDGKIVLLRRGINPLKGKWVLPGGYVDRGEEVEAAAIRETREECGLEIVIARLFGVYSYERRTVVVVVYLADPVGGDLVAGDESLEAVTFAPEQIPWESLAFPSTRDALKDYRRWRDRTSGKQETGIR